MKTTNDVNEKQGQGVLFLVVFIVLVWILNGVIASFVLDGTEILKSATIGTALIFIVLIATVAYIEHHRQISIGSIVFCPDILDQMRLWIVVGKSKDKDGYFYTLVISNWLIGQSDYLEKIATYSEITPVGKFEKYFMAMLQGKRHDH